MESRKITKKAAYTSDTERQQIIETETAEGLTLLEEQNLLEGNFLLFGTYIQSTPSQTEEDVNKDVRKMIADRYDYAQEIQMLNKAIIDPNDAEYLEYKTYRQECIEWGIAEKQRLGLI